MTETWLWLYSLLNCMEYKRCIAWWLQQIDRLAKMFSFQFFNPFRHAQSFHRKSMVTVLSCCLRKLKNPAFMVSDITKQISRFMFQCSPAKPWVHSSAQYILVVQSQTVSKSITFPYTSTPKTSAIFRYKAQKGTSSNVYRTTVQTVTMFLHVV